MAMKDKVLITLEGSTYQTKITVSTQKRDQMVQNLQIDTKEVVIEDKRTPTPTME